MTKNTLDNELVAMAKLFRIDGELTGIAPHKSGHINQTYLSTWNKGGTDAKYIHQKINRHVFKDVPAVMDNISLVLEHLKCKASPGDRMLELVPARTGGNYAEDGRGGAWRTYVYLEGTHSLDVCPDAGRARDAAALLGRFQKALIDLEPVKLKETIPNFLSTPFRFQQLAAALTADRAGRAAHCKSEVEFAFERTAFSVIIEKEQTAGTIPARAVHGDMKFNNVLFSKDTGRAVCIVDLDTCMSGYSLYDFGDLARSAAVLAAEDEQDFSKVRLDLKLFAAAAQGYLSEMGGRLAAAEIALLARVPALLALTLGVRFLADYLDGDTYFRVSDVEHNLRRTRTQFQLVKSMEASAKEMGEIVRGAAGG